MRKNSCKILCSALAFIYLCSCFSPAFSEDLHPYILDDAGTCISMPAGMIVFTKDSTKDDPYLLRYGLTTEQFVNYMAENLLSLVGFDQDGAFEVSVAMANSPLGNLNELSDSSMNMLSDSIMHAFQTQGALISRKNNYLSGQRTFLVHEIKQTLEGESRAALAYITIVEGKSITLTLTSYAGEVTPENKSTLDRIADSLVLGANAAMIGSVLSPSHDYTDAPGKITFTVPAGWFSAPAPELQGIETALFQSETVAGTNILLVTFDVPLAITDAPRTAESVLFTKNSSLSEKEIESYIDGFRSSGNEVQSVDVVAYGSYLFYKINCVNTKADGEFAQMLSTTHIVRVHKGRLYAFVIVGQLDALLADIDQLLGSIRFSE